MYGAISTTPSSAAASPTSARRGRFRAALAVLAPLTALCALRLARSSSSSAGAFERVARLDAQSPPPSASPPTYRPTLVFDNHARHTPPPTIYPLPTAAPPTPPPTAFPSYAPTAAPHDASTAVDAATPAPTDGSSLPPVPAPTVLPTDAPSLRPSPATGVVPPPTLAPSSPSALLQRASRNATRDDDDGGGAAAPRVVHVVYVLADDVGWNDVGWQSTDLGPAALGGGGVTPALDALARDGVILEQFYAMPSCTPSRSALLTGVHPAHNGLYHSSVGTWTPVRFPARPTTTPPPHACPSLAVRAAAPLPHAAAAAQGGRAVDGRARRRQVGPRPLPRGLRADVARLRLVVRLLLVVHISCPLAGCRRGVGDES